MQILNATSDLFSLIEDFLKPHEFNCVNLCAKIRKLESGIYIISNHQNIDSKNDIFGVFHLDSTLSHCIPAPSPEILAVLKDFLKDKNIKAVSGSKTTTELIVSLIEEQSPLTQINYYKLMTLDELAKDAPEPLSCDDQIIRCTEADLETLLDLQKQYLIKEVAPIGKKVTDLECRLSLRQVLKNQLMFALYADSEVVAKANSNAIGWNYVQIGGVYTHPLYRRNYYAWHLLKLLCDRIQRTNKKVCLFVKEKNIPAIKLYENIGFQEVESYAIAYF